MTRAKAGRSRRPKRASRQKRALTNVGGPVRVQGDPSAASLLATCLDIAPGEGLDRLTHGFHTYPARMHPDTAKRVVLEFSAEHDVVLDPFCGSGTVVLEAFVHGRRARGRDLNALAVRLAALRCRVTSETERRALREVANRVAGVALARSEGGQLAPSPTQPVLARPGATAPGSPAQAPWHGDDARLFEPVALCELSWLSLAISELRDRFVREALALVLSSLLIKRSRRASDTDLRVSRQRSARGTVVAAFRERARELSLQLKRLAAVCRAAYRRRSDRDDAPHRADLAVDDARALSTVPDGGVDLVITSPPYPNVYSYAEQHGLRARWLGIHDARMPESEVGSRLSFADPRQGLERWHRDGAAWTGAIARVLRPSGSAVVLGGDGASKLGPIPFDESLHRWAEEAGLSLVAAASQERPVFDHESANAFRHRARREYLLFLRKGG